MLFGQPTYIFSNPVSLCCYGVFFNPSVSGITNNAPCPGVSFSMIYH
jgi:hypothetical protein